MIKIKELFIKEINTFIFKPYQIDCAHCCGLCCTVLYFSKTDCFPENKNSGIPCKNLLPNYKCSIHSNLFQCGLKGCLSYDCFGAGQQLTKLLKNPPDWKLNSPGKANMICKSYVTIMQIQQSLWYLTQSTFLFLPNSIKEEIDLLLQNGKDIINQPLEVIQSFDITPFQKKCNHVLKQICSMTASMFDSQENSTHTKDYMGKNLKGKNLIGKDFSMSYLIASNLEKANLFGANFLGADIRDATIKNTDLRHSLFLTQIQINSAIGNCSTLLPPYLKRPKSWKNQ